MKFLVAELMGILSQKQLQKNVRLLVRYLVVLLATIAVFGKRGCFFASSMDFLERWP